MQHYTAACNVIDSNGGASALEGGITLTPTSFSTGKTCTTTSIHESVSMVIPTVFGGGSTSTTYTTIDPPGGASTTSGRGDNAALSTEQAVFGLIPHANQSGGARRNILPGRDLQTRQMPPSPSQVFRSK